jgi:hypothetical protein
MVRLASKFRKGSKDKGCGMIYRYCWEPFQWFKINKPTKTNWKSNHFGTHKSPKIKLSDQGVD